MTFYIDKAIRQLSGGSGMVGIIRWSTDITDSWISLLLGQCVLSPNPSPGLDVKQEHNFIIHW